MSKGVVVIVHGSRDPKWRLVFEDLVDDLRAQLGDHPIRLAYMELNSPTLAEVVTEFHQSGISVVDVLPLFMADGGHVDRDIPQQITEVQAQFPNIKITQLPPIGKHPKVRAAMEAVIAELFSL